MFNCVKDDFNNINLRADFTRTIPKIEIKQIYLIKI